MSGMGVKETNIECWLFFQTPAGFIFHIISMNSHNASEDIILYIFLVYVGNQTSELLNFDQIH